MQIQRERGDIGEYGDKNEVGRYREGTETKSGTDRE